MEFDFKKITIICLSYALFLFTPVFASAADIEVVGADNYWTSGIDTLADGLPDASDAQFLIPNEAQVFAAKFK